MNNIAVRLLNQQLSAPQYSTPEDLVSYMGAMQAQEYKMVRWAVGMRTTKPSFQAFQAAFDKGKIIRLHLMRGTWQLIASDDYWIFLSLCAPKAIAVIKGWMRSSNIDIDEKETNRIRDIIAHTADELGSATKEDFSRAIEAQFVKIDNQRLTFHLELAELSGIICSGNLQPKTVTYALTDNKIKRQESFDRDKALMLLTRKYFRSHQPATLEDFVWWSGLNIGDCRKGMTLLGDYLHKVTIQDRDFYLTTDCRTRGNKNGNFLLIPPYDEYLIGYKSRDIVLSKEYSHYAHDKKGIFKPVIAYDGEIVGNWSPLKETPNAEFFLGEHDAENVQDQWLRYKNFYDN